jgi:hypothetical protein
MFQGISPENMAKNTFTYLHFRILKFPLNEDEDPQAILGPEF